jgi:hypothetical protein
MFLVAEAASIRDDNFNLNTVYTPASFCGRIIESVNKLFGGGKYYLRLRYSSYIW